MFMSVVEHTTEFQIFPELAGARVLITGLTTDSGFDVARAFAEHCARLVIVTADESPAMTEVAALLGERAADIQLYSERSYEPEEIVRLVQRIAGEIGGFDTVINLTSLEAGDIAALEAGHDAEALVAGKLEAALLVSQVAANRMRLVWNDGLILNVVTRSPNAIGGRAQLLADIVRDMLGQLTRRLAQQWEGEGIRINAIVPQTSVAALMGEREASEVEIAGMALRLASRKGRELSGFVLDAAEPCC